MRLYDYLEGALSTYKGTRTSHFTATRLLCVAAKTLERAEDTKRKLRRNHTDAPLSDPIPYLVYGLMGELGELVRKYLQGVSLGDLELEAGDVMWYLFVLIDAMGLDIDGVARRNLEKLADRKERGVIHGKGDRR